MHHGCGTHRESVRAMLSRKATPHQLRAKINALSKLHDDIALHVGWPALCQSLRQDIKALREKVPA